MPPDPPRRPKKFSPRSFAARKTFLGPLTFLRDAFLGSFFLSENVNLMYFVRDVLIERLVVTRYRVYFCT